MSSWDTPTKCSSWKRFKGTRDPKCRGGQGCTMCWKKRLDVLLASGTGVKLSIDEMKKLGEKIQERLKADGLEEKPYQTTGAAEPWERSTRGGHFDHDIRHDLWCRCRRCE